MHSIQPTVCELQVVKMPKINHVILININIPATK